MNANPRTYGSAPYPVALVHGGPGAAGEMAPLARDLAARGHGVLEPLQTALSVGGQVDELRELLLDHAPLTLLGASWGAWLVVLAAARYPDLASKLILVGSGPFRAEDAARIRENRMRRLPPAERDEFASLEKQLTAGEGSPDALARLGKLASATDDFDRLPPTHDDDEEVAVEMRADIFERVWPEAAALRASGELMERVALVRCPVVAIHGEHDPHPADGVREPLSASLEDFRFHLLPRCGHTPLIERHAREAFLDLVHAELER